MNKKGMGNKVVLGKKPKRNWHTVEATSVLRMRWDGEPPQKPSGTRKLVREMLARYTKEDLVAMFVNSIEGFVWEKG